MIFWKTSFLLMMSLLPVGNLAAQNSSDERELIRLTKEISRASVKKDAATLERLMDARFVLYSASGKSYGKAALIKIWTKKSENPQADESSALNDFQITVFGKTAIVFSTITDVEKTDKGETRIVTKAFDVWQKAKKGWRWIASRETLVVSPNSAMKL